MASKFFKNFLGSIKNQSLQGLQFLLEVYYSNCQKWFDSTISSVHATRDKILFRKYAASGNVEHGYRVTKRASMELSSPLEQGIWNKEQITKQPNALVT